MRFLRQTTERCQKTNFEKIESILNIKSKYAFKSFTWVSG